MSSLEIDIFVLLSKDKNLFLSISIFSPSNLSSKVGKLLEGKHNKLKSEFFDFKLNLFSLFRVKLISVPGGIFLKISKRTFADVVVFPSSTTFNCLIYKYGISLHTND